MWFEYTQNNSGGTFIVDDKLAHRIFIESNNLDEANDKAESLGVYFDGVASGLDCNCCGDRWHIPFGALNFPYRFGAFTEAELYKLQDYYSVIIVETERKLGDRDKDVIFANIEYYAQYMADFYGWTKPDARIYYADGTVREIFTVDGRR